MRALHLPLCMGGCAGCACSCLPAQGLRAASAKANRCSSRRARAGLLGLQLIPAVPAAAFVGAFLGWKAMGASPWHWGFAVITVPPLLCTSPLTQP